jgi:hypothetical protein
MGISQGQKIAPNELLKRYKPGAILTPIAIAKMGLEKGLDSKQKMLVNSVLISVYNKFDGFC